MTDINKLRRLAETAQSPAYNINERMDALNNLHNVLSSGVVLELLDRLESTEVDSREQARLNGMGASREAALMAKLEAAEKAVNEAYQRGYATGQEEIEKELAELRSSMKFRTSLIGRTEAERDALSAELSKQQTLTVAAQHIAEVAQRRADALRAKSAEMVKLWKQTNGQAGWPAYNGEGAGR